jgi:hypothetical protein
MAPSRASYWKPKPLPLEQNRAQIPQRVKGLENIEKNFMNDLEAKKNADCVADPVQVEIRRVVMS